LIQAITKKEEPLLTVGRGSLHFGICLLSLLLVLATNKASTALPQMWNEYAWAANSPSDASVSTGGNWVMEGYNPQRDRATAIEVQPPLVVRREFPIGGDTRYGSPVGVANGRLFAEGAHRLHVLRLDTGQELWSVALPGTFLSPALAGDRLFVRAEMANRGHVLALDAASGRGLWKFELPQVGSSQGKVGGHVTSPLVMAGQVVIGSGRSLYALDAETGEQRWAFQLESALSTAAAAATDTAYVADLEHLYAVDLETGTERWRFDLDSMSLFFAPVVSGDRVIAAGHDTVYALDRSTGDLLWATAVPRGDLDPQESANIVPSAAAGERVYVKSINRLHALDRNTGAEIWAYTGGDFVSLPALTPTHLYAVTRSGGSAHLVAVRLLDGQETWATRNPRLSNAAPVVVGGCVYLRTIDGSVIVYMPSLIADSG
jgi:outer membrane protein assembly factor BamB